MDPNKFFKGRVLNFLYVNDQDFGNRMSRLLHTVVQRLPDLPDEEQFRFSGAVITSSLDNFGKVWEEFDKKVPLAWKGKISSSKFAPDMRQVEKKDRHSIIDGFCTYDFDLSTFENMKGMLRDENETKCDVCDLELSTPERLERHKKKAHDFLRLVDEKRLAEWRPFYVVSILTDNLSGKSDDYIIGLIAYEFSVMSCAWSGTKKRLKQADKNDVKDEARRLGFGKEIDALGV
jgi:hypothetical protein